MVALKPSMEAARLLFVVVGDNNMDDEVVVVIVKVLVRLVRGILVVVDIALEDALLTSAGSVDEVMMSSSSSKDVVIGRVCGGVFMSARK